MVTSFETVVPSAWEDIAAYQVCRAYQFFFFWDGVRSFPVSLEILELE